jgi:hypothetical protein
MRTAISLALAALLATISAGCKPRADRIDCSRTCGCRDHGLCEQEGTRCVASSKDECRSSRMCALVGRCTPDNGRCVVASDADCTDSKWCKDLKRCAAKPLDGALQCQP